MKNKENKENKEYKKRYLIISGDGEQDIVEASSETEIMKYVLDQEDIEIYEVGNKLITK